MLAWTNFLEACLVGLLSIFYLRVILFLFAMRNCHISQANLDAYA